jgi:hypothetical protein
MEKGLKAELDFYKLEHARNVKNTIQDFLPMMQYTYSLLHAHMEQDKINFIKFPDTQAPLTNQSILEIISELHEQLDDYNNNVNEIQKLRSMNEQSEFERMLIYLGPWLLAFALALRITKVTGELNNES